MNHQHRRRYRNTKTDIGTMMITTSRSPARLTGLLMLTGHQGAQREENALALVRPATDLRN